MYLLKQLLFLWLRNFTFYHALWHILGSGWHSASYREGKLLGRKFANFAVARVPAEIGRWHGEVQNIPQFLFRINKYDCRSQELEMPGGLKMLSGKSDGQTKTTDQKYPYSIRISTNSRAGNHKIPWRRTTISSTVYVGTGHYCMGCNSVWPCWGQMASRFNWML